MKEFLKNRSTFGEDMNKSLGLIFLAHSVENNQTALIKTKLCTSTSSSIRTINNEERKFNLFCPDKEGDSERNISVVVSFVNFVSLRE